MRVGKDAWWSFLVMGDTIPSRRKGRETESRILLLCSSCQQTRQVPEYSINALHHRIWIRNRHPGYQPSESPFLSLPFLVHPPSAPSLVSPYTSDTPTTQKHNGRRSSRVDLHYKAMSALFEYRSASPRIMHTPLPAARAGNCRSRWTSCCNVGICWRFLSERRGRRCRFL